MILNCILKPLLVEETTVGESGCNISGVSGHYTNCGDSPWQYGMYTEAYMHNIFIQSSNVCMTMLHTLHGFIIMRFTQGQAHDLPCCTSSYTQEENSLPLHHANLQFPQ